MTPAARATAPVFIVGGPRSGTTWLFHLLLSSGGFAADDGGDVPGHRDQPRRVDCSRENLLRVEAIKASEPNALFLHIVRDGRDVACSLARHEARQKRGSSDASAAVLNAALYWEWMLGEGRQQIRRVGAQALEIHFEELVADPRATLKVIGAFLTHELDYDSIRERGIGVIGEPNTAFVDDSAVFKPVGRWQRQLSIGRLARVESAVGSLLEELGYPLYTDSLARRLVSRNVLLRRSVARRAFSVWHWFRTHPPFDGSWTRQPVTGHGAHDDPVRCTPASSEHTV